MAGLLSPWDLMNGISKGAKVELKATTVQVVQEEGDLMLIPPRWWHQVEGSLLPRQPCCQGDRSS